MGTGVGVADEDVGESKPNWNAWDVAANWNFLLGVLDTVEDCLGDVAGSRGTERTGGEGVGEEMSQRALFIAPFLSTALR